MDQVELVLVGQWSDSIEANGRVVEGFSQSLGGDLYIFHQIYVKTTRSWTNFCKKTPHHAQV